VFNVGTPELLVILLVALIVLGPNKLPDAARQVGKFVGEMRRMSTGFQSELRDAMQEPVSTASPPRRSDPVPKATPAADIKPVSQVIPDESYAADPSSASPGVPDAGDGASDPPTADGAGTGDVAVGQDAARQDTVGQDAVGHDAVGEDAGGQDAGGAGLVPGADRGEPDPR
jgi:Tat protein translocase TatB subunit